MTVGWWWRRLPLSHGYCRGSRSGRTRWRRSSPVSDDGGSATLVGVAVMGVLLAITLGGVYIGSAVVARHRAQAAADLAALAAAARLPAGIDSACGQATAIANAMRVGVADCVVDELDVVVTIQAGPARAAARAGPADGPG
jgi:secretion/DNA translocation related TadE-like protein